MTDHDSDRSQPAAQHSEDDYVKNGKGRKDDVRGSRIYPASAPARLLMRRFAPSAVS